MKFALPTLLCSLFVSVCLTRQAMTAPPANNERLNIVVILADNCGKEWFGCYGSEERATPNIDQLAKQGTLFDVCYTVPICGPSRVMLLTGRYPYRTGWTIHHDAALYSGGGLEPDREVTVARPLREAGYRTAVVGKWQIDNLYDHPDVLKRHGFDHWCVWPGSIDRKKMNQEELQAFRKAVEERNSEQVVALNRGIESRYWDPVINTDGTVAQHAGEFGPDRFQRYALKFIEENRSAPFFLYYPMVLTHGISFKEHVVGVPPRRTIEGSEQDAYREMVRYLDRQVGELLAHLEALQLRERTLIVFATDNGTETSLPARFRGRVASGGLYTLDELGVNVPLIFNLPGTVQAGVALPCSDFTDLFPTICSFARVAPPRDVTIDGDSLEPVLTGKRGPDQGKVALVQYHTTRALRKDAWKLYSDGRFVRVEHDLRETALPIAELTALEKSAYTDLSEQMSRLPADAQLPFDRRSISAFQWGVR